MKKVIVIDEERCLACKQCVIECAMAHSDARTLAEAIRSGAPPQPRLHVEPLGEGGVPLHCQHCDDAPCLAACPTGAIRRVSESGPVLLDTEQCIGCRFCMLVCPFGVIDLSRDGKAMIKCDLCVERTEKGQQPACVAGCPTGAIQYRDLEEWLAERRRGAAARVTSARAGAHEEGGRTS